MSSIPWSYILNTHSLIKPRHFAYKDLFLMINNSEEQKVFLQPAREFLPSGCCLGFIFLRKSGSLFCNTKIDASRLCEPCF